MFACVVIDFGWNDNGLFRTLPWTNTTTKIIHQDKIYTANCTVHTTRSYNNNNNAINHLNRNVKSHKKNNNEEIPHNMNIHTIHTYHKTSIIIERQNDVDNRDRHTHTTIVWGFLPWMDMVCGVARGAPDAGVLWIYPSLLGKKVWTCKWDLTLYGGWWPLPSSNLETASSVWWSWW